MSPEEAISEIKVLTLAKSDVLIIRVSRQLNKQAIDDIASQFKVLFPNNRAIISEQGLDITVVREGEP